MKQLAMLCVSIALSCHLTNFYTVYIDPITGYTVLANQRYYHGAEDLLPASIDRGEAGDLNPAVLEYVFAAPEGPFARYYELVLALAERPSAVDVDLAALDAEARVGLPAGCILQGRDYARALGRKLARAIRRAMRLKGTDAEGSVGVRWGIPVDLDAGVPLLAYEQNGKDAMYTTIIRYSSAALIVVHSSAMARMLAWDVSGVPGAFDGRAALDPATVAGRIVALHGGAP